MSASRTSLLQTALNNLPCQLRQIANFTGLSPYWSKWTMAAAIWMKEVIDGFDDEAIVRMLVHLKLLSNLKLLATCVDLSDDLRNLAEDVADGVETALVGRLRRVATAPAL